MDSYSITEALARFNDGTDRQGCDVDAFEMGRHIRSACRFEDGASCTTPCDDVAYEMNGEGILRLWLWFWSHAPIIGETCPAPHVKNNVAEEQDCT